ncbi:MAG: ABC transporter ATP-binding protein [Firmicutes bacterium]|nr:ABC transporter ATP-binding protein [Bacillota bacterium]
MPLLQLQNVTRQYKSGQIRVNALTDVSLAVEKGEFISIMGPSGSGKSTLLNIIGCLDRPTSGTYILAGRHVEKLGDSNLAEIRNKLIGFVFQSFHLLPDLDAQANVELPLIYRGVGRKERRRKACAALEAVGLFERRRHLPSQLSGGEQQRVAIARALVGDPAVILADEPTGALDSASGAVIMSIFQYLNRERGMTIVQVTHEETIARHAGRVVFLRDGRIEREETVTEPLTAQGQFRAQTVQEVQEG